MLNPFQTRCARVRLAVLITGCFVLPAPGVLRGGIATYTDSEEWRAAASGVGTGVVQTLDFETLPDGSPTLFERVPITPDFNYTAFGTIFSSPYPDLFVRDTGSGGRLTALFPDSSGRNWIIADFAVPAAAMGIAFPGNTTLSVFDVAGELLTHVDSIKLGGVSFVGVVSEATIGSAIIDRGASGEILESFHFTPVPEPVTLLLLGLGGLAMLARKPRKRS